MSYVKKTFASYACMPESSQGRVHKEQEERGEIFLRDREKVIHSSAFRRLEYKTQVFVNHVGDHYRTRLTHSLEVSQIARIVAHKLDLNEDLAETVALSHDLGHPPFGHSGEEGLDMAASEFGGFDHNAHTLRILTQLEQRYLSFDGLNLSLEALDGIAKHNGPLDVSEHHSHQMCVDILQSCGLSATTQPSLEAQCAALADDIAYISHDIDDGLRANMFEFKELSALPVAKELLKVVDGVSNDMHRVKHEFIRLLSQVMIEDLVQQTLHNIKAIAVISYKDVIQNPDALVKFSPAMEHAKEAIKGFLMQKVYRNYRVNRMGSKAKKLLAELFQHYMQNPDCLPTEWYARIKQVDDVKQIAICVIDYIAGMTDRFALEEYKRLFDPNLF